MGRARELSCALIVFTSWMASTDRSQCQQGKESKMYVTATNPEPKNLPTLSVWQDDVFSPGKTLTMVRAVFPNVPDFTCESWCYESNVTFLDVRDLGSGKLELRHRVNDAQGVLLLTTVNPEPDAVEFVARMELEKPGEGTLPANLPFVNLCWQLRRAPNFSSAPDPYPEFIKRCFLFTDKGVTFLDKTERRKIPCRPAEDQYNNPPWVQMYCGTWQQIPQAGPTSWADYSTDRYTTPIVGTVSRDGKWLTAIANGSASTMAQAWHDCMHNNPPWVPANAPSAERRWRVKVYAMKNDAGALLARVVKDFPGAKPRTQ
ncbi:MAG: hypothetical protein HY318_08370 [Armatimonadetes bacterium]|nr:hypothetical protein [Armatimonadota bacterium]